MPADSTVRAVEPAAQGVRARIEIARLRPSELRVARRLLADYPSAGLATAGELAGRAGVSTQTVVRFVRALGFASFALFQDALRQELRSGLGPLAKLESRPEGETADLTGFARLVGRRAVAAFARVTDASIEATIDLLAGGRGTVLTAGGRFSTVLARHLALNLQTVRPRVALLEESTGPALPALLDLGPRDVVVLFDVQRYQPAIRRLADVAAGRGAALVVITDAEGSPAAERAAVRLLIDVAAPSPLDTLAGGVLLVEYLVARVTDRLGEAAQARLQQWEAARAADFT